MKKYKLVAKKGEGTFSEVVKAQNVEVGSLHAIKCMKSHFGSIQEVGFQDSRNFALMARISTNLTIQLHTERSTI